MFFLFGIPAILGILGIIAAIAAPLPTLVVAVVAFVLFYGWGERAGSGGLALVPHIIVSGLVAFAAAISLIAQHFS